MPDSCTPTDCSQSGSTVHEIFFSVLFIYFFYNIVLVLTYIDMNLPWVYACCPSWTPLPPPFSFHHSGSSQCTSSEHPVSCIKPVHEIFQARILEWVAIFFSRGSSRLRDGNPSLLHCRQILSDWATREANI